MPFNGSGVFTRLYKWVLDEAAGLNVDATRMDADSDDIASGLTNCLTRDGQNAPITDISWASHKIKDLANGTSPGDAVNYSQLSAVANETIAGTITIGTVTTGAAGSSATISNVGTPSAAVLNFSIPMGNIGPTGPQGIQGIHGAQGIQGLPGRVSIMGRWI